MWGKWPRRAKPSCLSAPNGRLRELSPEMPRRRGKTIVFVGTKRQAQEAVAEEATRCQQYYVNQRWLGGLLTNMTTVQKSIKRLKELDAMAAEGNWDGRAKKEVL